MTDQTESSPIASSTVIERTYRATQAELWELWTTKEGFASWWGPQGFRADVHTLEGRLGGALHYDMVADTPEMAEAMKRMAQPTSTPCRGTFSEFRPHDRLVLTQLIDFLPGVEPYDSTIEVDLFPAGEGRVRMVITSSRMHDAQTTEMQSQGMASQVSKLDQRYGWEG